jgi:hypothetical protein
LSADDFGDRPKEKPYTVDNAGKIFGFKLSALSP